MIRTAALLALCYSALPSAAQDLSTRFEKTRGQETATYEECIAYYRQLDKRFPQISMREMGPTDAGYPLHLVIYSPSGDFNFASLRKKNKRIILINNGIHSGEPDGIDASMLLLRDLALGKNKLPDNIVLAVIPIYNIGGALNRSTNYRVDQNGPAAFGSRGNARNYDLNRDFIKADSRNARSFHQIYQLTDPDVFVDNHVSNGADYQHVMTLLSTEHNKMGGDMGRFLHNEFEPGLYQLMKEKGYDLVPYVNHFGETPEQGWITYADGPRYSSGYTTLFHTFGFVPETHMLKPYPQRVQATYALMESFISFVSTHSEQIKTLRAETKEKEKEQTYFPLEWREDTTHFSYINFKGYAAGHKPSEISGEPRLYYDRTKPFEKQVKFYDHVVARNEITRPEAYVIPQGWWNVLDLLKNNNVQMRRFTQDTIIYVETYHIDDYKTAPRPYEGHYIHSDVKVSVTKDSMQFRKGDYYIPMNQVANRYLIETLEPTGGDSFFAWNFFDPILMRKEGYSPYVFEDIAAAYLKSNPTLQEQLKQKREADSTFAKSGEAQLRFVYEHSPYAEPGYLRYPVFRVARKKAFYRQ
ncbi:M14 family metallopeptidase [Chitinophaga filiformis]|uniref:M14 family metallopeptidase n=1 Tax=Chitinophaga filiformis TaxID=104663 RepID=A0ABY4I0K7_CHIFI|nr:M14 family metallopeptidase [Chitinophaga filiformis]UPK69180.1 M14 family metallopeptidase [Chitinophaga filiformis]